MDLKNAHTVEEARKLFVRLQVILRLCPGLLEECEAAEELQGHSDIPRANLILALRFAQEPDYDTAVRKHGCNGSYANFLRILWRVDKERIPDLHETLCRFGGISDLVENMDHVGFPYLYQLGVALADGKPGYEDSRGWLSQEEERVLFEHLYPNDPAAVEEAMRRFIAA
jgi:hypothetical protein